MREGRARGVARGYLASPEGAGGGAPRIWSCSHVRRSRRIPPARRPRSAGRPVGLRSLAGRAWAARCGGDSEGCEPGVRGRSPRAPPWGLASRAHGMRAADSGSWERVRQLAAHGQPAPSCGRDTGPARVPEPGACKLCADATGPREQQGAGAVPDAADGYGSQPGRCSRGREGGLAAGPGVREPPGPGARGRSGP